MSSLSMNDQHWCSFVMISSFQNQYECFYVYVYCHVAIVTKSISKRKVLVYMISIQNFARPMWALRVEFGASLLSYFAKANKLLLQAFGHSLIMSNREVLVILEEACSRWVEAFTSFAFMRWIMMVI